MVYIFCKFTEGSLLTDLLTVGPFFEELGRGQEVEILGIFSIEMAPN